MTGPHAITIQPENGGYATLALSILTMYFSSTLKYICCDNEFKADGVDLRRIGDVHLFDGERDGRPFVRAFFTSGLTFKKLVINFDASFMMPPEVAATGGRVLF